MGNCTVPHRDWLRGSMDAGPLLAAGARLPGVNAGAVAPGAAVHCASAPDHQMALFWRLVGLADWAREMGAEFR